MPTSKASAVWEGGLKDGNGRYEAATGSFSGAYTFASRFTDEVGTNPEELIAAAHAACLSMALSANLERDGTPAQRISTTATATLEKVEAGFRLTKMHLDVTGVVPNIDAAAFAGAADAAQDGCPVSNALKGNVAFTLSAKLE
jgi:osmotically inducible protein OsmC